MAALSVCPFLEVSRFNADTTGADCNRSEGKARHVAMEAVFLIVQMLVLELQLPILVGVTRLSTKGEIGRFLDSLG